MLGAKSNASFGASVPGGTGNAAFDITAGLPSAQAAQTYGAANAQSSVGAIPYVLVGLVALFLLWAVVLQHERLQEAVRPANIAVNLHNMIVGTVMVVIGIVTGKVLFTKLTAWNVPGAAWLGQIWAAA